MRHSLFSSNSAVWLALFLLFCVANAQAGKEIYTSFFSNKAVSGYDTVAYFTEGKPVKGNKKYQYTYRGSVWFFSSEKNKAKFIALPDKYAPQYGGFCAWAVSEKKTRASSDPEIWKIVEGKLYLNYDQSIQDKMVK